MEDRQSGDIDDGCERNRHHRHATSRVSGPLHMANLAFPCLAM